MAGERTDVSAIAVFAAAAAADDDDEEGCGHLLV